MSYVILSLYKVYPQILKCPFVVNYQECFGVPAPFLNDSIVIKIISISDISIIFFINI